MVTSLITQRGMLAVQQPEYCPQFNHIVMTSTQAYPTTHEYSWSSPLFYHKHPFTKMNFIYNWRRKSYFPETAKQRRQLNSMYVCTVCMHKKGASDVSRYTSEHIKSQNSMVACLQTPVALCPIYFLSFEHSELDGK